MQYHVKLLHVSIQITQGFLQGHCTVWWMLAMGLADLLGITDLHCRKYQMVKTQTYKLIKKYFYQPKGLYQYSVLNSMYRSGLVDSLVTPANTKGFDLTALSGVRRDVMPPQLKSVQVYKRKTPRESPGRGLSRFRTP